MMEMKSLFRDFTNWLLSYTLAQPVDIDLLIILYFVIQYTGLFRFNHTWHKVRAVINNYNLKNHNPGELAA